MKRKKIDSDILIFIFSVGIVLITGYLWRPEDFMSYQLNPHPFLVIALIFAAYRGLRYAFISSLFLIGIYFLILHTQIDYEEVESLFELRFLKLPFTILGLSSLVGELKQRSLNKIDDLNSKENEKARLIDSIKNENDLYRDEVSTLRSKLVFKTDSIIRLTEIANYFEEINTEKLLLNLAKVLKKYFHVEEGTLLKIDGLKYISLSILTEEFREEGMESTILNDILLTKAIEKNEMITFDLEKWQDSEGGGVKSLIAAPIISNEDDVSLYLLIEKMPFLEFVPQNIYAIEMLVKWFNLSWRRACLFSVMEQNLAYNTDTLVGKWSIFKEHLKDEIDQAKEFNLPLSILKIQINNNDDKDRNLIKILSQATLKVIRGMDFAAELEANLGVCVLVLGTEEVADGFKKKIISLLNDAFSSFVDMEKDLRTAVVSIDVFNCNSEEILKDLEENT